MKHNFFLKNRKERPGRRPRIAYPNQKFIIKSPLASPPHPIRTPSKKTRCFLKNYQAVTAWLVNNNMNKFVQFKKAKGKTNPKKTQWTSQTPPPMEHQTPCKTHYNTDKNKIKRKAKYRPSWPRRPKRKRRKCHTGDPQASGAATARTSAAQSPINYYSSSGLNMVITSSTIRSTTPSRTTSSSSTQNCRNNAPASSSAPKDWSPRSPTPSARSYRSGIWSYNMQPSSSSMKRSPSNQSPTWYFLDNSALRPKLPTVCEIVQEHA